MLAVKIKNLDYSINNYPVLKDVTLNLEKDKKYNLYCAVIVKKVDEKTRSKVGINELLREA